VTADAAARPLPVTAVLFDLDGTLADSAGDLALALNRIRHERGLPAVPVEELRAYASSGARGLLYRGMGITPDDADYAALREAFLANYAACLAQTTTLFDGVDALLDAIERRGLAWGIVTNKPGWLTDPLLIEVKLHTRARAVVSGDTLAQRKPHPLPLLHAAAAMGIDPAQCVYVGDAERDMQAAQAAGMYALVAGYGYLGDDDRADTWFSHGWLDTPLELLDWLDSPRASARVTTDNGRA